jgi:hypothetical protein
MILSLRNSPSLRHIKSSRDRSNRTVLLCKPTVFGVLKNKYRNLKWWKNFHDWMRSFSQLKRFIKTIFCRNRTYNSLASMANGVVMEPNADALANRDRL